MHVHTSRKTYLNFHVQQFPQKTKGAFHHARSTGQRPLGIPEENGTTFSEANQGKWLLPFFIPFPNSLHKWSDEPVCQNATVNFGRTSRTGQSDPLPEVDPNILVVKNRNGPFHLTSDRNFRNLWHSRKHPSSQETGGLVPGQQK